MEEKKSVLKDYLKKEPIIAAVVGLVVGIGLTILVLFLMNVLAKSAGIAKLKYGEEVLATADGKSVSSQYVYDKLKILQGQNYSVGLDTILNKIDNLILNDMYQLTEKEENNIVSQVNDAMEMYADDVDNFLAYYGCSSKEELIEYLEINEKTTKYLCDYLEAKLEKGAVQKYYDEHKDEIETYDSEHILVRVTDDVKDEDALAMANEIIAKLNESKTFDEIVEEYGDKIVHENLGYQGKDASLEQSYIDELVSLEDGKYSQTPVKTSYGYHVVHRLATATMEELRPTIIIQELSTDIFEADPNIYYKALIELRKDKNLTIFDEELNKEYEDYCSKIYEPVEE